MNDFPQFRPTQDDIDNLPDDAYDIDQLVASYTEWIKRIDELDRVIRSIKDAFNAVTIGDGIGMLEANGRDNYADDAELKRLRSIDCRTDWRSIAPESLIHSAPSFMDAQGFVFHIPAYLIAELNDQFDGDFLYRLYQKDPFPFGWPSLLNNEQSNAITATLALIVEHPNYCDEAKKIHLAIERLGRAAG